MTDRQILFTGPMVCALLDGRKTQTRRVIEPFEPAPLASAGQKALPNDVVCVRVPARLGGWKRGPAFRPRFAVGDRLWVRETFSGPHGCRNLPPRDWPVGCPIWRWADGDPDDGDWTKPKPGIHMPRWASRLTLVVTKVRVQRLIDIDEEDAIAEGVDPLLRDDRVQLDLSRRDYIGGYLDLWDSLNAKRGYRWEDNPWIVAITFTVHHANVDAVT